MSKIKVNSIEAATGSTITIPSGQTLDISSTTLTLPSTVVTTTGTQTLTNKTIGVSQLTGTLPVANGGTGLTSLGTASQVLRVNSGATALEFGTLTTGANAGEIIQVVSANKTDSFSSSATGTGTDVTGMSVNITPASTSNKILVMCSVNVAVGGAGAADILRGLKVVKVISGTTTNSSPVGDAAGSLGRWTVINQRSVYDKNGVLFSTMQYLDSPSTTSQITYKLQFGTGDNAQAGSIYINSTESDNYNRGASTITAMEVKG